MQKKISKPGIIFICIVMILGIGVVMGSQNKRVMNEQFEIIKMSIDKAMYNPGEEVSLAITIQNHTDQVLEAISVVVDIHHIDEVIEQIEKSEIRLEPLSEIVVQIEWTPPVEDFKGYLAVVEASGEKNYSRSSVGFDVASDWRKFPRYGYVCRYEEDTDVESIIHTMVDYHINAIEYYDWHHLHHQPIAEGVTRENPASWQDWAGRWIEGDVVAAYIEEARARNMVNMGYNMIYAGTDSFFLDENRNIGDKEDWKIYFHEENDRGEGAFTFSMGFSPSGNGNLYFVNPLNPEWQAHIFKEQNKVYEVFDFDGWHGDTVGDWGEMVTFTGEPLGFDEKNEPIYTVKDTYTAFLNEAKEAMGDKYLTFNPVGAQGIEKVNKSNVDALYTEFWPWDTDREGNSYNTYYSLVNEVERSMEESKENSIDGKGKSLTVKAYINYYKTHGTMNEPGVLLADAAVYAAGGSRLELGDGDRLLHFEYYPDNDILMSDDLKDRMRRMSDFIVAYENVLRDGQQTTDHDVLIEDVEVSKIGESNTVWTYTRADEEREILHLINLLGTDNEWRDERGKKEKPGIVSDLEITYYTDKKVNEVVFASPDSETGECSPLAFKKGRDEVGSFITFTVPRLEYWNMILID